MLSGIITVVLLLLFVGGWIWIWNPKRKPELDAAARLPLDEKREDGNQGDEEPGDREAQP